MKNATARQLLDLVAKFSQSLPLDLDRAEVQKAIENPNHLLWQIIRKTFTRKGDVFVFGMDYGLPFKQLFEDLFPERDTLNSSINPNSPWDIDKTTTLETIERHLIRLRSNSSLHASNELEKNEYESATLKELMVFGALNPEIQCNRKVCVLGSGIRIYGGGYPLYQLTKDSAGERQIHLPYSDNPETCITDCWFLVKKLKK